MNREDVDAPVEICAWLLLPFRLATAQFGSPRGELDLRMAAGRPGEPEFDRSKIGSIQNLERTKIMHPVAFLFEEINREWGIPQRNRANGRKIGFRWRGRHVRPAPERN